MEQLNRTAGTQFDERIDELNASANITPGKEGNDGSYETAHRVLYGLESKIYGE
jgi:hypothetical protein